MAVEKISAAATYTGAGTAAVFGLTPGQWQAIGVIGGIVIGIAGVLVNAYFGWRRDRRDARERSSP